MLHLVPQGQDEISALPVFAANNGIDFESKGDLQRVIFLPVTATVRAKLIAAESLGAHHCRALQRDIP